MSQRSEGGRFHSSHPNPAGKPAHSTLSRHASCAAADFTLEPFQAAETTISMDLAPTLAITQVYSGSLKGFNPALIV